MSLFFLGFGTAAAIAGSAVSSWGFYTVGGHQYQNQAWVITTTGNGTAIADTTNAWTGGGTQTGWAAARGRVFECSSNNLKSEGSVNCNQSGQQAFGDSGVWSTYAGNAAYGNGVTWGWDPNSQTYSAVYTFKTPCQNT